MKKRTVYLGLVLVFILSLLTLGCDSTGNSPDDATNDTNEEFVPSPPDWVQDTWKFEQSNGYWSTYLFSAENVVFEDSTGASTNYAEEYGDSVSEPVEDSTDSSYSITVGDTEWEWTLEENGTLLFKSYYDGSESTSLTKHYIPSDMIAVDGTVLIDDEYADYAVYVVAEDSSETVLGEDGFVVESGTGVYDYTLYVDAAAEIANVYAVIDPDNTFDNGDESGVGLVGGDFSSVAGGDTSFDNDFPIAALEGEVTISDSTNADDWTVAVGAFDSDDPSGEPSYDVAYSTTSGTAIYNWSMFINTDGYPDDVYVFAELWDDTDSVRESGAYGSNPQLVSGGNTYQDISFETSPPDYWISFTLDGTDYFYTKGPEVAGFPIVSVDDTPDTTIQGAEANYGGGSVPANAISFEISGDVSETTATYSAGNLNSFIITNENSDAITYMYTVDPATRSTIELIITQYDATGGVVKGTFSASDPVSNDVGGDGMVTNGEFSVYNAGEE